MKIAMVAPLPPPYGGIANWMVLMDDYVEKINDIEFVHINIAPKARTLDGRTLWERIVGQGFAMFGLNNKLKNAIKNEKIDVVHMTTSGQLAIIRDIMMLKTAKRKRIPTVYHIRFGRIPQIAKDNTREWRMMKKAMTLATRVIAIDTTTLNAIQTYAPEANVCYIPNPFNLNKPQSIALEDTTAKRKEIVFIGWVIKNKGVEELLAAWEKKYPQYPDWKLRIIGPYANDYYTNITSRFSTKNVIFDGEKKHDEAMQLLSEAEIFILPSYTEGFPNAVVEAMALKKPIIASSVGAIPDMINTCGVVIPPQDVNAIEFALDKLISNDKLRYEMGQKARARMESEYTIENVFSKYAKLWLEVIK